jgi:hypothetical protein
MPSGRWVDTPAGKVWLPEGWRLHVSHPRIGNIKGKDPRKFVSYNVRVFDPRGALRRARYKARRSKHHLRVTTVGTRYRERDLDQGLFLNKGKSSQIKAQTVLGVSIGYDNYKRVSGVGGNLTAGGDMPSTLNYVKTLDEVHPGPPYRAVGPFKSVQYHLPSSDRVGYGHYTNQGRTSNLGHYTAYDGAFIDDGSWLGESYSTIAGKTIANVPSLSQYHTAAWDQLKPKLPKAGLAQFIYELKDLPGQLQTTAELFHLRWKELSSGLRNRDPRAPGLFVPYMGPKEASDQFLNEEFGWKPFISDIQKLFDVFLNTTEYIANIVRDNGQWIRKRRVLEESDVFSSPASVGLGSATIPSSEMRDVEGFPMCQLMNTPFSGQGRGYCVQSNRDISRVWAVGDFKFYRDEFDVPIDQNSIDLINSVRRLITIYGLRINPTLLYKVYPWTWAVDWFTGLGKHIERLDDFIQDGIVSRGLCVMKTTTKVMTKTSVLNFYSGQLTLNFQRWYTFKQREYADTGLYGFNVPWNQLTPRQWAILGAIGISRTSTGYISRGA